ncbi:hypothetical protein A3649_14855 [Mycobacterium ulcerans]|nr:hypothetical protein A3649_14855 [Mycobacterium ulcerans]
MRRGADGNAAAFRERLPAPVSDAVVLMAALMAPVRHGPSSAPSKARASGGVWAPTRRADAVRYKVFLLVLSSARRSRKELD